MNRGARRRLLGWVVPLTLAVGGLEAQVYGKLAGSLADASGAGLARGRVTIESRQTGVSRTAITDGRGFYRLGAIPIGTYDVTASHIGFRTVTRQGIRLRAGQSLALDLRLAAGGGQEVIQAPEPGIENTAAGAVAYLGGAEMESLPDRARDFTELALLAPGVQRDTELGFLVIAGQRAIHSGLLIDGHDGKSGFLGYARGGQAMGDESPALGLSSIAELQVLTGFDPEHGGAGGYLNLITRRGGNRVAGSAFASARDDSLVAEPVRSPLESFLGAAAPIDEEFDRNAYGFSIGGPLRKDRTHYFWSWEQADRAESDRRSLRPGTYDALRLRSLADARFAGLLSGWRPNGDGLAAADPELGRTAFQLFDRELDTKVFLGRIDHQFGPSHSGSLRWSSSDYELRSGNPDEESIVLEDSLAIVARFVSVIGSGRINEAGLEVDADDLGRLSARTGQFIEAEIGFADTGDVVGKTAALPIRLEEATTQVRNDFSFLLAGHDLRVGLAYRHEDASHLFAPGRDGHYRFETLQDFLDNEASSAELYFGDVTFPNYQGTRETYGLFAQDRWRPAAGWSVTFGLRYDGTRNPGGFEHLFAAGRDVPDDDDNLAPRLGFSWTPDAAGKSIVRGGLGLFFAPSPSSIFAGQVRENGLYPHAGRVELTPEEVGFEPLGDVIDHQNPPPGIAVAAGYVDPSFEDAEYLRGSLGYEREFGPGWTYGVDLVYADGRKLPEQVDINRSFELDEFGRPVFSADRPLTRGAVTGEPDKTPLGEVLTRQSIGESSYRAVTLKIDRRFSGRYRLSAHYTRARDEDTSSNERATSDVTLSRGDDPSFDLGSSAREVENRLLVSGLAELPFDFSISGLYEYRGGRPFNPVDREAERDYCPGSLGLDCPDLRPVVDGRVLARNSFRNESVGRLDLRVGKFFVLADRYRVDFFLEIFNVFDEAAFEVDDSSSGDRQRDPRDEQFGLASERVLGRRQMQIGARFTF